MQTDPKTSFLSLYRTGATIETLERIHRVTGQETPISGDAPLRAEFKALPRLEQKLKLNTAYGRMCKRNEA